MPALRLTTKSPQKPSHISSSGCPRTLTLIVTGSWLADLRRGKVEPFTFTNTTPLRHEPLALLFMFMTSTFQHINLFPRLTPTPPTLPREQGATRPLTDVNMPSLLTIPRELQLQIAEYVIEQESANVREIQLL